MSKNVDFVEERDIRSCQIERICDWCGEKIKVGEPARRIVYKIFNIIEDFYHLECYEAILRYNEEDVGEGWDPRELKRGKTVLESMNIVQRFMYKVYRKFCRAKTE